MEKEKRKRDGNEINNINDVLTLKNNENKK